MSIAFRRFLVVLGTAAFVGGSLSATGAWPNGNVTGLALAGFACWLASTFP